MIMIQDVCCEVQTNYDHKLKPKTHVYPNWVYSKYVFEMTCTF